MPAYRSHKSLATLEWWLSVFLFIIYYHLFPLLSSHFLRALKNSSYLMFFCLFHPFQALKKWKTIFFGPWRIRILIHLIVSGRFQKLPALATNLFHMFFFWDSPAWFSLPLSGFSKSDCWFDATQPDGIDWTAAIEPETKLCWGIKFAGFAGCTKHPAHAIAPHKDAKSILKLMDWIP